MMEKLISKLRNIEKKTEGLEDEWEKVFRMLTLEKVKVGVEISWCTENDRGREIIINQGNDSLRDEIEDFIDNLKREFMYDELEYTVKCVIMKRVLRNEWVPQMICEECLKKLDGEISPWDCGQDYILCIKCGKRKTCYDLPLNRSGML